MSGWKRWLTWGGFGLVVLTWGITSLQFQNSTLKAERRAQEAAKKGIVVSEVKATKGAIGRWRSEAEKFWAGQDIYQTQSEVEGHPNMPAVVVMLTPFYWMPVAVTAVVWNLLKIGALLLMVWMAAQVVTHESLRIPGWVIVLGVLAAMDFFIGDIQHGNTNIFVALCVIGHLWLFRNRYDWLAGALLAMGIVLKVTPALFLLYWAWQREWRVLVGAIVSVTAIMLMPALFVGWERNVAVTSAWWGEIVLPGVMGGKWYPTHINQSLPGIIARFFTSGTSGNYLWDPDLPGGGPDHAWVTLVDLGNNGARWLLRGLQVGMLAVSVWAIGKAKLPRDDGRRGLHYGVITSLMLLLNQRSWDHHAPFLLIADLAIVYAVYAGALPKTFRRTCGWILALICVGLLMASGDLMEQIFGDGGANKVAAYGTAFWHFLGVWALCTGLAWRLKKVEPPYRHIATLDDKRVIRGHAVVVAGT